MFCGEVGLRTEGVHLTKGGLLHRQKFKVNSNPLRELGEKSTRKLKAFALILKTKHTHTYRGSKKKEKCTFKRTQEERRY